MSRMDIKGGHRLQKYQQHNEQVIVKFVNQKHSEAMLQQKDKKTLIPKIRFLYNVVFCRGNLGYLYGQLAQTLDRLLPAP